MVHAFDFSTLFALAASTATFVASAVWSTDGGFVRTGEGIKSLRIGTLDVRVYVVRHDMRQLPAVRSRKALIEADVDKRFTLRLLRDMEAHHLQETLRDALLQNGSDDPVRIRAFLAGLSRDVKAGTHVVVSYDARTRTTSLAVDGVVGSTVESFRFMTEVWSVWLGKGEAAALAEALVGRSAA
jgi:hypothetical protein